MNKLQWNFNRNSYILIQGNAFENVVWQMAAILSRPQDNQADTPYWLLIITATAIYSQTHSETGTSSTGLIQYSMVSPGCNNPIAFQQRAHYTFRGWLWTHQQITHCTRVDISSSCACVPTRSGSNGQEPVWGISMMTSSNGNIFRVTGPLCGEFTGPGEFPTQRPVTRSFDVFFDLRLNKRLGKQPWGWWFETPSWSLWRQCNESGCLERYTAATKHLCIAWTKTQSPVCLISCTLSLDTVRKLFHLMILRSLRAWFYFDVIIFNKWLRLLLSRTRRMPF